MTNNNSNQCKPYTMSDLPALEKFFSRNYKGAGRYGTEAFFKWKIVYNPFCRGIIKLVKDNEEIISVTSATPKKLKLHDHEYIVAEIGDAYTEDKFQRKGLFALLVNDITKSCLREKIEFVYATPNKFSLSLPVFLKKADYKVLSNFNIESLILPLDFSFFLKQKGFNSFLSKFGNIISFFYKKYVLKKMEYKVRNMNFDVRKLTILPDAWDNFWEKASRQYEFIFFRDRDSIRWRFLENPNEYNIYVIKQNDQIVGYTVYRIVENNGMNNAVIADYLFLKGFEDGIILILCKILKDYKNKNLAFISTWCDQKNSYYKIFKQNCFSLGSSISLVSFGNDFTTKIENECISTHFTISDSDNV